MILATSRRKSVGHEIIKIKIHPGKTEAKFLWFEAFKDNVFEYP